MINTIKSQRGAVSIFIVIFTALLVTVVTTGFVQIMLRNQEQATNNDLSQSAYDSALAGVEDAKRALVRLKKCQQESPPTPECGTFITAMTGPSAQTNCELLGGIGIADFTNHEVQVGSEELNQAYTCVTVKVQTPGYTGELTANNAANVIPLIPVSNSNGIMQVKISWFTKKDVDASIPAPSIPTAGLPAGSNLPSYAGWQTPGSNRPPIMRAQLIQFDGNSPITLSNFDTTNTWTRFLYPMVGIRPGSDDFTYDTRGTTANDFGYGGCEENFDESDEDGYACSMIITLPAPSGQREAYLHLGGIYINDSVHYRVQMLGPDGGADGVIDFDNVQPEVDSTGRASDLFRRVRAHVDITPGPTDRYPDAAVSTNALCKEFFITNDRADYDGNVYKLNGSTACAP